MLPRRFGPSWRPIAIRFVKRLREPYAVIYKTLPVRQVPADQVSDVERMGQARSRHRHSLTGDRRIAWRRRFVLVAHRLPEPVDPHLLQVVFVLQGKLGTERIAQFLV